MAEKTCIEKRMMNLVRRLWREIPKLLAFGAVGIVNALINYTIFISILWYGLEPLELDNDLVWLTLANVMAWAVAVTNSYILNSLFTFAAETGRKLSMSNYLRFAATGLFGMGMETTVLLVAREIITGDYATEIAKIISIGFAFVVNFTATRFFVFRSKKM